MRQYTVALAQSQKDYKFKLKLRKANMDPSYAQKLRKEECPQTLSDAILILVITIFVL